MLFLASTISQTIDVFINVANISPDKTKVLYIPTAGDFVTPRPDLTDHDSYTCLIDRNFKVIPCELDKEDKKTIKEKIDKTKIIVMGGGNTYFLLHHINQSGFRDMINKFLENGGIYVGSSAGSCICSPDISYVKDQDDPKMAPDLKNTKGLGLIDFDIYPHCIEPWYENFYPTSYLIDSHKDEKKKVYLRDHQAVVVKDGWIKLINS
ncbi:MAG: Type 1 glutamine amidotransferase-like domain-containing protein [Patescibacteria group bacterium]